MREIEFRGKRIDNGEWVYGDLMQGYHSSKFGMRITAILVSNEYESLRIPIDPATVGQYTGIKDKNGKEIYEDDILDAGDRIVKVRFNIQCGCWDSDWVRYVGNQTSNGIAAVDWKYRAVVIGNVHDNPELITGEGAKA